MPAPLAKGLIIAASVIVAAGVAIYESPQVRQWVDQSRRKIAVALHSLGDEVHPPRRPSESSETFEERKKKKDELLRKRRNELVRKARVEGIAVDLDELAKIGREEVEMRERKRGGRADKRRSFDDLVGDDGTLKKTSATTTGKEATHDGIRKRGAAGLAAGSAAGATMSNPFADDQVLVDLDDKDEAPSPRPFIYTDPDLVSHETSATLEAESPAEPSAPQAPLIDLTVEFGQVHPENPQTASIPQSEASNDDGNQTAQSFYSFTSSPVHSQTLPATQPLIPSANVDSDPEEFSAGTLTPRSDRSAFTGASLASSHGDQASEIALLSMQNDADHDARSEGFSEGDFTDAGFSEAGFSELEVGNNASTARTGVLTPNSWTDIGSDDESEWGGMAAGAGTISQGQQ